MKPVGTPVLELFFSSMVSGLRDIGWGILEAEDEEGCLHRLALLLTQLRQDMTVQHSQSRGLGKTPHVARVTFEPGRRFGCSLVLTVPDKAA